MREDHTALPPDGCGAVWCVAPTCNQHWPCDVARLLALVTWHPDGGPHHLSLWDRILLAVMQGPVNISKRKPR